MRSPQRRLVVLARWPAPGRCKQRLAADCGATAAAAIQKRLSWHTIQTAAIAAEASGAELVLAASGLGPRALRRWGALLRRGHPNLSLRLQLTLSQQGGGNLGCRMQRQWQRAFAAGCRQVVLIGSDLPGLEAADLQEAFALLEERPLVLGPANDGGYWLIGLNHSGFQRSGSGLMSGMPWGSDQVLAVTLQRANRLKLPTALLRRQSDLDRRAALEPWLLLEQWLLLEPG